MCCLRTFVLAAAQHLDHLTLDILMIPFSLSPKGISLEAIL